MATVGRAADNLSATEHQILQAIDAGWRTIAGIKKYMKLPAMESISDEINSLVIQNIIVRQDNSEFVAFFRPEKLPLSFWKEKDGSVGAEYPPDSQITDESTEESTTTRGGREKIQILETDVEKFASRGIKNVKGGLHEVLGVSYSSLYTKFKENPALKDAYMRGLNKFAQTSSFEKLPESVSEPDWQETAKIPEEETQQSSPVIETAETSPKEKFIGNLVDDATDEAEAAEGDRQMPEYPLAERAMEKLLNVATELVIAEHERWQPNKTITLLGDGNLEICLDYDPFKAHLITRDFVADLINLCERYEAEVAGAVPN